MTRCPRWLPWLVMALTVAQLLLGTFSGWQQYDGKGFGWRLAAYPLLMLVAPMLWWWAHRGRAERTPWGPVTMVWSAFLLDVSGNTADLFDRVAWWDDAMHFGNWAALSAGLGMLLLPRLRPAWLGLLTVAGLGALLAIGWELGEWYTFIRRGVELDGAYEDTLGDLALGTAGALVAGAVLARLPETVWPHHDARIAEPDPSGRRGAVP